MKFRDDGGRFRKRTDDERWPDPRERRIAQEIRALYAVCNRLRLENSARYLDDVKFYSGTVRK